MFVFTWCMEQSQSVGIVKGSSARVVNGLKSCKFLFRPRFGNCDCGLDDEYTPPPTPPRSTCPSHTLAYSHTYKYALACAHTHTHTLRPHTVCTTTPAHTHTLCTNRKLSSRILICRLSSSKFSRKPLNK